MTRLFVPRERRAHERRVAATPETVAKFIELGCSVSVERDAGAAAWFTDADYREAGADVTFPDGLPSAEDHVAFAKRVPGLKMANMTEYGRTPFFTGQQFQDMGFDIVIWPATSMRAAAKLFKDLYGHIKEHDGTEGFMDHVMSRADQYDTLAYYDYEALDASVARTVLPEYGK